MILAAIFSVFFLCLGLWKGRRFLACVIVCETLATNYFIFSGTSSNNFNNYGVNMKNSADEFVYTFIRTLHFFVIGTVLLFFVGLAFGEEAVDDTIRTEAQTNSTVTTQSTSETTLKSPPPSAILPTMNNANSDLCTVGVAGTIQTQILGLSAGKTLRDLNCERLKNAKTLYDMGMKVAAVSVMCQDE